MVVLLPEQKGGCDPTDESNQSPATTMLGVIFLLKLEHIY